MANDKYYKPGSNYILDDRSGFKIRVEDGRLEWDQLYVSRRFWEPRQSQDFVKGVRDEQTVAVARPRQTNQFTIVGTWVTAFQRRLQSTIQVNTTQGFLFGDQVTVMLDEGDPYYPYIVGMTATSMDLCPVLPHSVGRGIDEGVYFGQENSVILWRRGVLPGITFVLGTQCQDILGFNVLA